MKITYLGHAAFMLDDGKTKLLLDPFLTGNPAAAVKVCDIEADYIGVTHGHSDHVGDTEEIARRTGAAIISTIDTADALFSGKGYKLIVGNIGGEHVLPFGKIKYVSAVHGSGVPGGLACGFLINIGGEKIYYAGDTALTTDMQLLKPAGIDVAILPIGDVFTMGPGDAIRAAEMTGAKLVIPMHYNTFPVIRQDPNDFAEKLKSIGVECAVLAPGETLEP